MTTDEFFAVISQKIDDKIQKNSHLKMLKNKIEKGNADFRDTFEYNNIVNETMGEYLADVILSVPERQKLAEKLLGKRYSETNDMLSDVQRNLDKKTGLNIQPKKAPYPDERITKVAHSLEDKTIPDEKIQRRARNSVPNVANSFHDDYMKENASLRTDAGIKCYIERDTDGNCCPWCTRISGKYEYVSAPDDIFKRHDNCSCTCTYINGRTRQDVWSKKKWQTGSKFKPKIFSKLEAKKNEMENLQIRGVNSQNPVDNSAESGIMNVSRKMSVYNQNPPDFSKYQITENLSAVEEIKTTISESLGISLDDIDLKGIKNTEALEPFVSQLKKIKERTGMNFPKIMATEIIDGDVCCIAGFKPIENRLYISSKYFNSKQILEDTMKEWAKNGIIPKQATNIRYLAEHEAAHIRIPDSLLESEDAKKINRQFNKSKFSNLNDFKIEEFFADSVAWYYTSNKNTPNKMIEAIEFLKKEGII